MTTNLPLWEQRIRAAQLVPFSLISPAVDWAREASHRGVLLSTRSGRAEVYTFDASRLPASLRQVTDRPQGSMGGAISSDGEYVLWFDDHGGDEVGRWVREPFDGPQEAGSIVLAAALPAAYNAGVIAGPRRTFLGQLTDDGLQLVVADGDGTASVIAAFPEPGELVDVSRDQTLGLVAFAPDGDWLHPGARVVSLTDGSVVAELVDHGRALSPVGFSPGGGDPRVLLSHERTDRNGLLLWNHEAGTDEPLPVPLPGDLSGQWWSSDAALLVTSAEAGRHTLHRYELVNRTITPVPTPRGTVHAAFPHDDGRVSTLVSSAATPPSLVRTGDGPIVNLEATPPPPSVPAIDVYAEGPGGQVHALLMHPNDSTGSLATVFLVHGGPTAQDLDAFNNTAAALVDAGYAVVRVNYRGSTGYGASWRDALHRRLGFTELEDVAAIRSELERSGVIDSSRVGIAGGSWGGYVTLFALGVEPDRWQCGAAMVPLADWFVAHEDQPAFMTSYDNSLMGGTIQELPDDYRVASPMTYVDNVRAPVFITAGANDPRCPPRQTDGYVERLRERGHDVAYERWDSGHGLHDMAAKVREVGAILSFLNEKLPPDD